MLMPAGQLHALDYPHLTADFTNSDGSIKKDLFTSDNSHLSPAGSAAYVRGTIAAVSSWVIAAIKPRIREQYLLLNYSTSLHASSQAQEMMGYVRDTFGAASQKSRLKVGLSIAASTPSKSTCCSATGSVPLFFHMTLTGGVSRRERNLGVTR
jgi:hypothetical protein